MKIIFKLIDFKYIWFTTETFLERYVKEERVFKLWSNIYRKIEGKLNNKYNYIKTY